MYSNFSLTASRSRSHRSKSFEFLLDILNGLKKESSCSREAALKIQESCDDITEEIKSAIADEYIRCRAGKLNVKLPEACTRWLFWITCDSAIVAEKNSIMWTTRELFYHDIDKICFAHMFDRWKEHSQREYAMLHKMDRQINEGIFRLLDDLNDMRSRHDAYFQSIDDNIRESISTMRGMKDDLHTIRDISDKTARKL